jgi:hypothetical protein
MADNTATIKPPAFVALPALDRFALAEDYRFRIGDLEIWIPAGFSWNGASLPRPLWSEMGGRFEPNTLDAGLPHDWAYLTHCVDRAAADKYFRDRCLANGMSHIKAEAMYEALRLCGETHWVTSEEDKRDLAAVLQLISGRPDKDKFLASIKTA